MHVLHAQLRATFSIHSVDPAHSMTEWRIQTELFNAWAVHHIYMYV